MADGYIAQRLSSYEAIPWPILIKLEFIAQRLSSYNSMADMDLIEIYRPKDWARTILWPKYRSKIKLVQGHSMADLDLIEIYRPKIGLVQFYGRSGLYRPRDWAPTILWPKYRPRDWALTL